MMETRGTKGFDPKPYGFAFFLFDTQSAKQIYPYLPGCLQGRLLRWFPRHKVIMHIAHHISDTKHYVIISTTWLLSGIIVQAFVINVSIGKGKRHGRESKLWTLSCASQISQRPRHGPRPRGRSNTQLGTRLQVGRQGWRISFPTFSDQRLHCFWWLGGDNNQWRIPN